MLKVSTPMPISSNAPAGSPAISPQTLTDSRASDLVIPDYVVLNPPVPITAYRDGFGNWCSRLVAPAGEMRIRTDGLVNDSGLPEPVDPNAWQHAVEDLPAETLVYLLGSRYCETDRMVEMAWDLFHGAPPGYGRVQAICDYVHHHLRFGYEHARATKTALEAFNEGTGVCRDYTHLAITFCRCMNIPARYCTGYLGDIGVPPSAAPMDFAASFEAFLAGRWHIFDPRNNQPRIGRVLIAQGRDAADVPISNAFGPSTLTGFRVWTDEVRP
jgi:transglutaminase-like putative cysteine protease